MRVGWGLLVMMTLGALIISVPRKGRRLDLLSIFLLTSSFLSIREVVDGNFEVLVISGVAITIYADRRQNFWLLVIGLLLATAKPQEVWLLMIVLGVYLLRTQTPQRLAKLAGALAIFVIPALVLVGFDWIGAMKDIQPPPGSILDISLWAALGRLGVLAPIAIVSCDTVRRCAISANVEP